MYSIGRRSEYTLWCEGGMFVHTYSSIVCLTRGQLLPTVCLRVTSRILYSNTVDGVGEEHVGKCMVCTRLDDVASTRFGVKVVYSYVRTRQLLAGARRRGWGCGW